MKRLSLFLVVFGVFALVVSGCSGSEDEASGEDETTAAKVVDDEGADEAAEVEDEAEMAAEDGEDSGDDVELAEIGVPECDEYVEKYMTCISEHVPEEASTELVQAFKASQDAWAQAASNEAARETLAETCTQALAAAQESMQAYDCEW
jgi:hypothetical protein